MTLTYEQRMNPRPALTLTLQGDLAALGGWSRAQVLKSNHFIRSQGLSGVAQQPIMISIPPGSTMQDIRTIVRQTYGAGEYVAILQ